MVRAAGSGQAATLGAVGIWWKPLSSYRVRGACRTSVISSSVILRRKSLQKGPVPHRLLAPSPQTARRWGAFSSLAANAAAVSGPGASADVKAQGDGSRQQQRRATGDGPDEESGAVSDGTAKGSAGSSFRGRTGNLLALGSAVALELLLTGSLVWTPLAAAAVALMVLPGARALTEAQAAARVEEAVARAEVRVRAEMSARVPVSPPESAVWLARLMGELWEPFVQPLLLEENLGHWAEKVRRAAPAGLELQLEEMSLGREAPRMSNFQVFADPMNGRMTAIDCDMSFDSSSMRLVVSGSGPVGRFTATMTGINMRGRMRLLPIPDQRIILFSFREPPQIDPKLTLEGPFLGARDIPPTSLLRSLLAATLQDCLVEPVRGAISLDPEPLVGQPVDTIVNIYIESVQGITADSSGPAVSGAASTLHMAPASSSSPSTRHHQPQPNQQPQHRDDAPVAAFLASLLEPEASSSGSAAAPSNGGSSGGATAAVVAAASSAAVAASEAVAEGAGAIASLVPGLSAVAGGPAVEGAGRGSQQRLLQVVAINMDNKLQRETKPVPYTPHKMSSGSASTATSRGAVVPVLQMLRLNVGHKDTIYKLLVKDMGRSSGGRVGSASSSVASAPVGPGSTVGVATATPPSSSSSIISAPSPLASSPGGSTSTASSTPSSVAAAVVSGLPTPGLMGSVRLHVAAAKDGRTLFWAAGAGGDPVAIRWSPSDGPWRVTLPLESPTYGLPAPVVPPVQAAVVPVPLNGGSSGKRGIGGDSNAEEADSVDRSPAAKLFPAGAVMSAEVRSDAAVSAAAQQLGAAAPVNHDVSVEAAVLVGSPSITLLVSADQWAYKDARPSNSFCKSPHPSSVVLQVVEARDLAAHDWAGTCDPYVRISYDGRTYRTRTLYNTYTPIWQQTFILSDNRSPTSPSIPPQNRLLLSVFDSGVSRDDRLGSASLNLDMATEHQLQDKWIPLQGAESGWLRVRLTVVPDLPDSAAVQRAVEALEELTHGSGPLLQVVVLSVRALSPRRGAQLLGQRDAYCNIVYGGARHVTQVIRQDQNPHWGYSALFVMQRDEDAEGHTMDGKSSAGQEQSEELRNQGAEAAAGKVGAPGGKSSVTASTAASNSSSGVHAGRPSPVQAEASNVDWPSAEGDIPLDSRQKRSNGESGHGVIGIGGEGGSSRGPLPPSTPISRTVAAIEQKQPPQAGGAARSRPQPRFHREFNRDMLRLEVKDVAPVPPDEDLGWVELPVRTLLPQPGDSWQGWLPLRRGEGAELLVRISRIDPLPLGQGALALPLQLQQQVSQDGKAAGGVASGPSQPLMVPGSSGGGPGPKAGLGAGGSPTQSIAPMERVLLDSFTIQVRAANRAAGHVGQDLRVRLGQDVIPKLQDWWEGSLQHTVSLLEQPSAQLNSWLRNPQLIPAAWMGGISAVSSKLPLGPQQQQNMLPSPRVTTSRTLGPADGRQVGREENEGLAVGALKKQLSASNMGNMPTGRQHALEGSALGMNGGDTTAPDSTATVFTTETDAGSNTSSQGERSGFQGQVVKDGGLEGGGRSRTSRSVDGGGLGQRIARTWERLLGNPAYQPKLHTEKRSRQQQEQQQAPMFRHQQQQAQALQQALALQQEQPSLLQSPPQQQKPGE